MARQGKTLPARRQQATNDSLLIRSAESLGRMIGSLQRQLDAARHPTDRATGAEFRGNGHPAVSQRNAATAPKKRTTSSRASDATTRRATSDRTPKRAVKSAAKKTGSRKRSARLRTAKKSRGT